MGLFDGCLLVSDIDGTLMHDGLIPKRNIEAIEKFKALGGKFTVASGRSIEASWQYYKNSGANCSAIVFNGAVLFDYEKDEMIYKNYLPEMAKTIIKPILEEFPDIGVEVHSDRTIFVLKHTEDIAWHLDYEKITATNSNFEEVADLNWIKALFASSDLDAINNLQRYTEKLNLKNCYFLKTADIYLELTCGGVNKGVALKRLADHVGIDHNKVFAIGDYYNDVEMLNAAAVSAAVETSPKDIKSNANYVSCSCEKGAVADFIEYLTYNMPNQAV